MLDRHPPHASRDAVEPTLRVFEGIDALTRLIPAWEDLLAVVPRASIFSTWEWLSAWWNAFGGQRRLITLAAFDAGGSLVGLAPLSLETHHIAPGLSLQMVRLMGDGSGDSDNLDLLVVPGCEAFFVNKLLDFLSSQEFRWDVVQCNTFSDESPIPEFLLAELQRRGWTYFSHLNPGTVIDLPDSWESYLRELSSGERWKRRKYFRALRKKGLRVRKSEDDSDLLSDLTSFFDLHQRRWQTIGEPGAFASPARRQFYTELARLLASRGWLEFWLLELNDKTVAGEFDFRYRDAIYNLQGAFDPAYAADQMGSVLRTCVLQQSIAAGVLRYDFLAGDDAHKKTWGGRTRYYRDIHFASPRSRGRGSAYLHYLAGNRMTKAWLRPRVSPALWAAMRRVKRRLVRDQSV